MKIWQRLSESLAFRGGLAGLLAVVGGTLILRAPAPVVLTWETASEVGTIGFNVYRAQVLEGEVTDEAFMQVNATLIPSQGDVTLGATYRYEDKTTEPWRRYHYRIEEMEWDGATRMYIEVAEVRSGLPTRWVQIEGATLILIAGATFWHAGQRNHRSSDAEDRVPCA